MQQSVAKILMNIVILQEDASYQEILGAAVSHFSSFFTPNSTLMRSLEDARVNLTEMVSEAMLNSSVVKKLNETLQEKI